MCDTESHVCGFRFRRPKKKTIVAIALITMAWHINLSRSTTEWLGIFCVCAIEARVLVSERKLRDKVIRETNAAYIVAALGGRMPPPCKTVYMARQFTDPHAYKFSINYYSCATYCM